MRIWRSLSILRYSITGNGSIVRSDTVHPLSSRPGAQNTFLLYNRCPQFRGNATDQGGQFTSQEFTRPLLAAGIRISMDGRGRVYDNIFIERLWRTVKYEEVYLHEYQTVREARQQLAAYFPFYNDERPHQGLGDWTPAEVYHGERRN